MEGIVFICLFFFSILFLFPFFCGISAGFPIPVGVPPNALCKSTQDAHKRTLSKLMKGYPYCQEIGNGWKEEKEESNACRTNNLRISLRAHYGTKETSAPTSPQFTVKSVWRGCAKMQNIANIYQKYSKYIGGGGRGKGDGEGM